MKELARLLGEVLAVSPDAVIVPMESGQPVNVPLDTSFSIGVRDGKSELWIHLDEDRDV